MKLIKFLAFLFILAVAAGGCNINIGSNVMTIYPGANVTNASQEQEANITLTSTMPEAAQGQGESFLGSVMGFVALVVVGVSFYIWQRQSSEKYI